MPKQDAYFTTVVAKIVDTLRNLLNNDPAKLAQHVLVDERPVDAYLSRDWRWNDGRYGTQRSLREMSDVLNKVHPSPYRRALPVQSRERTRKWRPSTM
jgi:V-type H+-transporting ATPase subunit C